MIGASQHELHPDAELLNAFAERALGERERDQVLIHLAACRRCRQVVALAHQAVGPEHVNLEQVELEEVALPTAAAPAVAASVPARTALRRPWWRNWHFAWIPASALVATAGFAVYLHVARVAHNAELAQNNRPVVQFNKTTAQPAPQEQPKALPPAPSSVLVAQNQRERAAKTPAEARSEPKSLYGGEGGQAPSEAEQQAVVNGLGAPPPRDFERAEKSEALPEPAAPPPPMAAAELPPPAAAQTVVVTQSENAPQTVSSQQIMRIESPSAAEAKAPQTTSTSVVASAAKKQRQGELKELAEQDRQLQATAARASNRQSSGPAPAAPTTAAVYRRQTETRGASIAAFAALHGAEAAGRPIHLPSGLAVVSTASANHRMLAIDKAGTLFLSEDSGLNWHPVRAQWPGRAILVRAVSVPAPAATPSQFAENSTGAAPVAAPAATFFEIVNDKNQVFQSTDGTSWVAK